MEILKVYKDDIAFNVIAQYPSGKIYNLYGYDFSHENQIF